MDSFIRDLIAGRQYIHDPLGAVILTLIVLWSLAWKGVALWHSAQNKEKYWFVAILILNTAGILEIGYLFIFSVRKLDIKTVIENLKALRTARTGQK